MSLVQTPGTSGLVQNVVYVAGCHWLGNSAEFGGSIALITIRVNVFFDECTFQNSVAALSGGSLRVYGLTTVLISLADSVIYQSRAEVLNGGAIYADTTAIVLIRTIVGQTSGECSPLEAQHCAPSRSAHAISQ